jgi:hypothetical protein
MVKKRAVLSMIMKIHFVVRNSVFAMMFGRHYIVYIV